MEKIHTQESVKERKPMPKAARVALIAAVIAALLIGGAAAAGAYISSEDQAVRVAVRELQVLRDMGIIAPELKLDGSEGRIIRFDETAGSAYWFFRKVPAKYSIQSWGGKYSVVVDVDISTGKILSLSLTARADEDAVPVPGKELKLEDSGEVLYYYENFADLFDPGMTVGEMCGKLCEYWGYAGYSIADTADANYEISGPTPTEDSLLTDCYSPYITVYFEGDQAGVPQYLSVMDLPQGANLIIGMSHAVG